MDAVEPKPASLKWAGTFYFLFYAASASLSPFLVLYYEHLGLDGDQIGVLAGLPPALILVGAAGWGAVADATQRHRLILCLAIAGSMGAAFALSQVHAYAALVGLVVALAIFQSPITPLVDNSVLDLLGEARQRYGRIRIWGAIGWGLTGPVASHFVDGFGLGVTFLSYIGLFAGCLVVAWIMPLAPVHVTAFWSGLRALMADRRWRQFLFLAFASGAGLSVVHHYFFLYLESIGTPRSMMGYALTIGTASEMIAFYFGDRLLSRWGPRRLMVFAVLAGAVRVAAYALTDTPALALTFQLLHGATFALFWVAGVSYAQSLAPAGLGATAQGQFMGVNFGLGGAVGAVLGGVLFERLGLFTMYGVASAWLVVSLALYLAVSLRRRGA